MKFLLIGYNEIDGLGQHVASLNTNLNNMGHKSKAIFLHKSKKENNNTIKIKRSLFHRIIFKLHLLRSNRLFYYEYFT